MLSGSDVERNWKNKSCIKVLWNGNDSLWDVFAYKWLMFNVEGIWKKISLCIMKWQWKLLLKCSTTWFVSDSDLRLLRWILEKGISEPSSSDALSYLWMSVIYKRQQFQLISNCTIICYDSILCLCASSDNTSCCLLLTQHL